MPIIKPAQRHKYNTRTVKKKKKQKIKTKNQNKNFDKKNTCYMIYLLTAIGLLSGGSSTAHIYTQTIHRTTQVTTENQIK